MKKKFAAGIEVGDVEEQIDEPAADLWGLTEKDLKGFKESSDGMQGKWLRDG